MTQNKDISWLWGMRGIAIICVVLYHWFCFFSAGVCGLAVRASAQGAHTFFILSAFGLYFSLSQNKNRIDKKWFIRRLVKVLFPYYLAVLIVCVSIVIYGILIADVPLALRQFDLNAGSFWATMLLYRSFMDQYLFTINTAWWFVITILQFYLLFPLICYVYQRLPEKVFLLAALFINLFYQYFYSVAFDLHSAVYSKLFPAYLFEYSVGIYLSDLYVRDNAKFNALTLGVWPFAIGLILRSCGMWLALNGRVGYAFNNVFTSIGFFLIAYNIYIWMSYSTSFKACCGWLGKNAFSIFLLHESFIVIIFNLLKGAHPSPLAMSFLLMAYLCFILPVCFLFQKFLVDRNIFIDRKYA